MAKLFKTTPLEDSFTCNFNILVAGQPRVMGVREILNEWTAFRDRNASAAAPVFDLQGQGKAPAPAAGPGRPSCWTSTRPSTSSATTEEETEVVPNLMIGFGIDEVQADYVAEIKLRHLNREYILKRTEEIEDAGKGHRRPERHPGKARPSIRKDHHRRAEGGRRKSTASPAAARSCTTLPEEESGTEEGGHPGLSGHRVLHPRGLF